MKLINQIKNKFFISKKYEVRINEWQVASSLVLGTCLLALTLASCSDDLDVRDAINENYVPDGYVQVNFTIPDSEHIITRAIAGEQDNSQGERNINSLTILVFNTDGSLILQREDVDLNKVTTVSGSNLNGETNADNSFSYTFKSNQINTENKIYVIANHKVVEKDSEKDLLEEFTPENNKGISDLQGLTYSLFYDNNSDHQGYFMSGEGEYAESNKQISVDLKRSAGKLTLKDETNKKDKSNLSFELTGFTAYNLADACYLTAATNPKENQIVYNESVNNNTGTRTAGKVTDTDGSVRFDVAVNPTINLSDENLKTVSPIILIQGTYNDDYTYYAVPLYNRDENKFYDIEPNHWYEMQIKAIKGPGYTDKEVAIANPFLGEENITVEIHDHAARVYNMISDGIRELGVPYEIKLTSSDDSSQQDIHIKLYSINEDELEDDVVKGRLSVSTEEDWLELYESNNQEGNNDGYETSGDQNTEMSNGGNVKDSKGIMRIWGVSIKDGVDIYSKREGTIKVEWEGLTREITVIYDIDFNLQKICNVELEIFNGDNNSKFATIQNYWEFINQRGDNYDKNGNTSNSPLLWGIGSKDMDRGTRQEGLHFPMPYGNSNQWEYKYKLTFADDVSNNLTNVKLDIPKTSFFYGKIEPIFNESDATLTIDLTGANNSYTYDITPVTIIGVYNSDEKQTKEFGTMSFYHTGFFHYVNEEDNYYPEDYCQGYYYYEVVEMGGAHWLDRNVGAKSAMMFVNNGDGGADITGVADAAGLLYKVATPGGIDATDNTKVNSPEFDTNMCPPGYTIPSSTEWSKIRTSTNFKSSQLTLGNASIFATYYEADDTNVGNVYFPKSRYYNTSTSVPNLYVTYDKVNSGDAAAGYYWSTSEAEGLEKVQIGQFLKVLNISGTSSSYINGSIKDSKMNIRCIAASEHSQTEQKYSIDFNVKGATHVFLYTLDENAKKTGIFSFPGKAIGSQSAVDKLNYDDDNSYIHFSYSSSIPAKENGEQKLYVFFAYVTEEGEITVISKNNEKSLDKVEGWPVEINHNYFFDIFNDWEMKNGGSFEATSSYTYENNKTVTFIWPNKIYNADHTERVEMKKVYVYVPSYDNSTGSIQKPSGEWDSLKEGEFNKDTQTYSISYKLIGNSNILKAIFNNGDTAKSIEYKIGIEGSSGYYCNVEKNNNGDVTVTMIHMDE